MAKSWKRVAVAVVVAVAAAGVAAFVFDRFTLSSIYARVPARAVSLLPNYSLYEKDYPRTDVEFFIDDATLRGHVYGANNNRGLIVFRHGLFSQHEDYLPFITAMVDRGWRVFAYDAIGCGDSDGDSTLGMSQSPIDVVAAIDYVRESGIAEGMPIALWGHSWGGYGVAAALAKRADVDACVTMSGFDSPVKILTSSAVSSYGIIGSLQTPLLWLNTVIDFGDNADVSASGAVIDSGVPTLVIHGAHDKTVPLEGASVYDALQQSGKDLAQANITLKLLEEEGRDGHNDYFYSHESQAYLNECAEKLTQILEEHGNDANASEVQDYLASVDMKAANTADPALIEEIDAFFATQLPARS